jgi:hypothetical protein
MNEIKSGDRIKMKNRQDWYLPSGYLPSGVEGQVVEVLEEPQGFIMVTLDQEVTGIDKRVPLGFRIDAVEKTGQVKD